MNIEKARKKLEDLIKEIESEGTLYEHGCWIILDDLREIRKLLEEDS
jgi:hypothetical protein